MGLGERVRERMALQGLSQAELARRVGISQPSVYALIHKNKTGSRNLHLIARALETTPAYLSGETDDPDQDAPAGPSLSYDQLELIDCYDRLDDAEKAALLQIARVMAGKAHGPAKKRVHDGPVGFRPEKG